MYALGTWALSGSPRTPQPRPHGRGRAASAASLYCKAQLSEQEALDGGDAQRAAPRAFTRRSLGAAVGLAASGCALSASASSSTNPQLSGVPALREYRMVLRATALRGSVPQEWLSDFRTAMDGFGLVAMTQKTQLADIYRELQGVKAGKLTKPTNVDVVTVGDAWLERAIQQGLVQPIAGARDCRWWSLLPPRWRQLVCRNRRGQLSAEGEVWGAPYRWGCTLVAYQKDRLLRWGGTPINDWGDLLQPGLKGRIGFVDSPREFVGVALKTLGLPYNASAADLQRRGVSVADLRARVQQLKQQVRVFSNTDHIRAMTSGDVSAVVGWSEDLLGLRATNVALAAPASGTALWADLWCVPTHAAGGWEDGEPSPLLPAWLELPLHPVRAVRSKGIKGGASPLLLPPAAGRRGARQGSGGWEDGSPDPQIADGSASWLEGSVMPPTPVLQRSEFLLPLDQATIDMYNAVLHSD